MSLKICIGIIVSVFAVSYGLDKEGGYVGSKNEGNEECVYNFLRQFSYEQYYYTQPELFSYWNNSYIDQVDIAVFSGHGNNWYISSTEGGVDLRYAGNTYAKGYGNFYSGSCKFIVFEACKVVPSPLDVSDWSTGWIQEGGIFDGLHQALGFRTTSLMSTDQNITDEFGKLIKSGNGVWQAWFDAIDKKGARSWCWTHWRNEGDELGSVVMYPACDGETYYKLLATPPINHQDLSCWYQRRD